MLKFIYTSQCVCVYCQESYIIKAAKLAQIANVLFSITSTSVSIKVNIRLNTLTFISLADFDTLNFTNYIKYTDLVFQCTFYNSPFCFVDDVFMSHLSTILTLFRTKKLSFFKPLICIFLSFFKSSYFI